MSEGGREGGREGDLRKLHVKWNNDNNYEPPTDEPPRTHPDGRKESNIVSVYVLR